MTAGFAFDVPGQDIIRRIATIRRSILALKRHMSPQHVALEAISRDGYVIAQAYVDAAKRGARIDDFDTNIRRIGQVKEKEDVIGSHVRVKVVKNKVAPPFRQAEFDIEFGKGISTAGCLIDLGIEHNVVTKSGSFFSYGDERLGQGRNNAKAYLDEHVE